MRNALILLVGLLIILACAQKPQEQTQKPQEEFDIIIRNGTIYDGSGGPSYSGDIGLRGDTIAAIGNLANAKPKPVDGWKWYE